VVVNRRCFPLGDVAKPTHPITEKPHRHLSVNLVLLFRPFNLGLQHAPQIRPDFLNVFAG
jgi:hypothetical protein